jgi:hypothetical protein
MKTIRTVCDRCGGAVIHGEGHTVQSPKLFVWTLHAASPDGRGPPGIYPDPMDDFDLCNTCGKNFQDWLSH